MTRPDALGAIGALVGPVVFFFIIAGLMRRTQEMRLTTRAMAEIAARLAEPETIATEQVVSLSHAIRREVASMGDGIERSLARASELESIVRNEVGNLERSYAGNERRIRGMIDELANEREAIVSNAERCAAPSRAPTRASCATSTGSRRISRRASPTPARA